MLVCQSAWNNQAPNGQIFMKFDIWVIFKKLYVKFKLHYNQYFTKSPLDIFVSYLIQFFLEWEMFQTKVIKDIKTHVLCSTFFFIKSCSLWDNVEKYYTAGQAADDNMAHVNCTLDN
jgi:hypothetical protein